MPDPAAAAPAEPEATATPADPAAPATDAPTAEMPAADAPSGTTPPPHAPEPPEPGIPQPRPGSGHMRRLPRVAAVFAAAAVVLSLGYGVTAGGPDNSGPVSPGTTTSQTQSPGQSTAPTTNPTTPEHTTPVAPEHNLPGSDLRIVATSAGGYQVGSSTLRTDQVNFEITNDGKDASGPITVSLERSGVPADIKGWSGSLQLPDYGGESTDLTLVGGKLMIPSLPSGAKASLAATYNFNGTPKNVTIKVEAPGSTILTQASSPTTGELGH